MNDKCRIDNIINANDKEPEHNVGLNIVAPRSWSNVRTSNRVPFATLQSRLPTGPDKSPEWSANNNRVTTNRNYPLYTFRQTDFIPLPRISYPSRYSSHENVNINQYSSSSFISTTPLYNSYQGTYYHLIPDNNRHRENEINSSTSNKQDSKSIHPSGFKSANYTHTDAITRAFDSVKFLEEKLPSKVRDSFNFQNTQNQSNINLKASPFSLESTTQSSVTKSVLNFVTDAKINTSTTGIMKKQKFEFTTINPLKYRKNKYKEYDYYYYDDSVEEVLTTEPIIYRSRTPNKQPLFNVDSSSNYKQYQDLTNMTKFVEYKSRWPSNNGSKKNMIYSAKYKEEPSIGKASSTKKTIQDRPTTSLSISQRQTSNTESPTKPHKESHEQQSAFTLTTKAPTRSRTRQTTATTLTRGKHRLQVTRHNSRNTVVKDMKRAEATTSGPEPASATSRTLVSTSQYSANSYSPYEQEYDDKVKYEYNSYNEPQPSAAPVSYRSRTPAPSYQSLAQDDIQSPKRSNAIQNDYVRNIYQEQSVPEYHDVTYDNAEEDHSSYRQSSRQQLRDDRKESNLIEDQPTPKSKHRISTTYSSSTSRYTTKKPIKSSSASVSHKQNTASSRTNNRGRGTGHYTSGNVVTSDVTVNTINVNRGTPPPRSRPTLKPSTSIVSKAQEFVDIYRYPPRRPDPIYPQPQPDKTAAKCRKDVCLLPDCNCGGKDIPGDIPPEQVPQIVLLTFDDSVNDLNKGLYQDLFEKGRVNPNGCPISATFYVSHEWTDYSQVQNLYSDGHEIASHTVSHSFGEQFSQKKWTREVAGQREILAAYGGVHLEDVRGMRAPFLSVGGNKMFKMLYDSNFTYDSSMPIYENKPPSWPYTLDYKLFHDCMIPPCPTRSYPGVWEVPMVMWQDLNGGRCSMGDACSNPSEPEGVRKMIMKNFMRHYTTNRAPFGLFYHAAWFTQPHHKEGFINLLDDILAMKDVWVLTNWQAVEWVRNPTPTSRLGSFKPFQCDYSDRPKRCNNPKVCNLWHKSGVRYMRTCQPCPEIYPWTGNSGIRSSRIDNDIED